MRKIKFRAWYGRKKSMWQWDAMSTEILENIDEVNKKNSEYLKDKLIIMQYTGLKDKKKKEIYEGDIVKYLFRKIWEEKSYYMVAEIKYNKETLAFELFVKKDKIGKTLYKSTDNNEFEVIGNIYENPELLTK